MLPWCFLSLLLSEGVMKCQTWPHALPHKEPSIKVVKSIFHSKITQLSDDLEVWHLISSSKSSKTLEIVTQKSGADPKRGEPSSPIPKTVRFHSASATKKSKTLGNTWELLFRHKWQQLTDARIHPELERKRTNNYCFWDSFSQLISAPNKKR